MFNPVAKLIDISSEATCKEFTEVQVSTLVVDCSPELLLQLECLLKDKNGFYAFESALHVFPANCISEVITLEEWNLDSAWKESFEGNVDGILFFAEDVFGGQYGIQGNEIVKFEPEDCEVSFFAEDVDGWALKILNDFEVETGYPLASEWQRQYGAIKKGCRLVPKIPFILGGEYIVDNLFEIDNLEGMLLRADIWKQIRDLPDGAEIELRVE